MVKCETCKGGIFMYYRIGEFSEMTNLSIRTLRYYDEINLLNPEYVDPYSGYRYYTDKNLDEANIIQTLKDLSFSLEEIIMYKDNLTPEILELKENELIEKRNMIGEQINTLDNMRSDLLVPRNQYGIKTNKRLVLKKTA